MIFSDQHKLDLGEIYEIGTGRKMMHSIKSYNHLKTEPSDYLEFQIFDDKKFLIKVQNQRNN